jgi:UDP-glucose:(heptosyl)LPS alpha-1,3-glucosyltransferase
LRRWYEEIVVIGRQEQFTIGTALQVEPLDSPQIAAIEADFGPQRQKERLRVAIVSPEVGPGAGVPHYWQALANVIAQRHEVHVFTARTNRVGLDGIEVHRVWALMAGWFLLHATFYLAVLAFFSLARMLRRRQFDLVLGIGALTPFADVATVHFVQAREQELQSKGSFQREQPRAGFAGLDYALYSRTMGWLSRKFYRGSHTRIVAISEAVKRDLVLFEGATTAAIAVIPNGVDIERFHPANRALYREATRRELGLSEDQVMVLFVGNSWGRKGLCTAIEAIRGSEQSNVRLVVVGQGLPDNFLHGLPAEDASRILFAGRQQENVERFYAAADVFILPTLYEPFGLVILEALASGLPSIVSAAAGASEWLTNGVDALLLPDPSDGEGARAALHALLTRPELGATLSENGRRKAEELRWEAVADRIIAVGQTRRSVRENLQVAQPEAAGLILPK